MVALPEQDLTIQAIYKFYEDREAAIPARTYLGGSELGEECRRALFYGFRHVRKPKIQGRILRLFETGDREEQRVIANLRAVGIEVLDKDPSTGKQWEYKACDGHMQIHFDGVVLGLLESPKTWHLLETKSSNQKYHNQLVKHGCEKAKPVHWAQMQIGMGLAGLKRAVYISICKNDDAIYFERVQFDKVFFDTIMRKANAIIKAEEPPERIGKDASFFKCKLCDLSDFCWGQEIPDVSCRTCAHGSPAEDETWKCAMEYETNPSCQEHIFLPSLLHWAEPIDGDPTWVKYRADGYEFVNGAATGFPAQNVDHYSSRDLRYEKESTESAKPIDPVNAMYGPPLDYGPPLMSDDELPF